MSKSDMRRALVTFLHESMGTDMFSSAEMFFHGQDMLKDPWPKHLNGSLKNTFKSLHRIESLANVLNRHPDFEPVGWDTDLRFGRGSGSKALGGSLRGARSRMYQRR